MKLNKNNHSVFLMYYHLVLVVKIEGTLLMIQFQTMQKTNLCGSVKEMTLSDRIYQCTCGLDLDRDYNSARNIKKEGIRLLASS